MTPGEFRETILMKDPIIVDNTKPRDPKRVLPKRDIGAPLPKKWDWRAKGAVTPVKDQGQCGSCWAFSVTENIESMWILAGKATNETISLSPQQFLDCDWTDLGCNGGNTFTAYEYVERAGGLESITNYPYLAEDGTCQFDSSLIAASISTWHYANTFYQEDEMQQNFVAWGPLSVCVDASNWQDYQNGTMTASQCAYINLLDHCVQLVAYDATDPKNKYYVVRNSWNTDWGMDGFIQLEMNADTCGITHEPTCSVI